MSISLAEKSPISAVILDFDGTFYSYGEGVEIKIWDKARRVLINKLLDKQGKNSTSKPEFEALLKEFVAKGKSIGWSTGYVAMGGDEAEFDKVIFTVSKAEFLEFDQKLSNYLQELLKHVPVYIFTGSSRATVLDALKVLIGDLYTKFDSNLLAGDDLNGLRKPQVEAYREMIKRFDINPIEAVFVDDHKKEVDAATSLGIKTFLIQEEGAEKLIDSHVVINSIYEFFEKIEF